MTQPIRPLDTSLPDMLRSGKRLRGVFNGLASPAIVEMCAFAGFDFLVIDNEHGPASFETTEEMLRAARASGLPTLVRCLEHDVDDVAQGYVAVMRAFVVAPAHMHACLLYTSDAADE